MEKQSGSEVLINNDFYESLHEGWYEADDHPIALLRAENGIRIPWIQQEIAKRFNGPIKVLDVGCGAGFLTNALALQGHEVVGIDLSGSSLDVAKKHDTTNTVKYLEADAYALPFPSECFDVVCAMDILEHVDRPQQLIHEASRVLRPGGIFFFHTFNRTWLSYMLVIKGVDWFVPNAPKNMHVYHLFITPKELETICKQEHMQMDVLKGFAPKIMQKPFWELLYSRKVSKNFQFLFTNSLQTGYCGIAIKKTANKDIED